MRAADIGQFRVESRIAPFGSHYVVVIGCASQRTPRYIYITQSLTNSTSSRQERSTLRSFLDSGLLDEARAPDLPAQLHELERVLAVAVIIVVVIVVLSLLSPPPISLPLLLLPTRPPHSGYAFGVPGGSS